MKLMMLDLETLSTRPDAVVWQIGALTFDPNLDAPIYPAEEKRESGVVGEPPEVPRERPYTFGTFSENVAVLPEVMMGAHIDPETVAWWQKRRPPISTLGPGCSGNVALQDLFYFWEREKPDRIVANSPNFDCVIIENMARRWGMEVPWRFRSYLDCRTISFVHDLHFAPVARGEVSHDALDDCRAQALRVAEELTNVVRFGGSWEL